MRKSTIDRLVLGQPGSLTGKLSRVVYSRMMHATTPASTARKGRCMLIKFIANGPTCAEMPVTTLSNSRLGYIRNSSRSELQLVEYKGAREPADLPISWARPRPSCNKSSMAIAHRASRELASAALAVTLMAVSADGHPPISAENLSFSRTTIVVSMILACRLQLIELEQVLVID
eukprot:5685824-Pleurochrysis_carterae.AAC.2